MFINTFTRKKVLITGHTGFKGTWLSSWLIKLGANVIGYSNNIPTKPSMFEFLALEKKIKHIIGDVRDLNHLSSVINEEKPDFVFHLAAQAIVSTSYTEPVETMTTNIVGTMNILEAFRTFNKNCTLIMITSDKCYDNLEWIWGYRESDSLGGKDVYSGSKGAAELVIKSYYNSFFKNNKNIKIGIGRAGNVIGGGDWAKDRIIVDCIKAWSTNSKVEIRCPTATRPWQHVLEPLSGYLSLAAYLSTSHENMSGEAFNFGPRAEQNRTVVELISDLAILWGFTDCNEAFKITDNIPFHEAGLLKLNCDKALAYLKWESTLTYSENLNLISEWYKSSFLQKSDMFKITLDQIERYEKLAYSRNRKWTE
jgi:CDP-glucose 4,6-dehydratase